MGALAMKRLIMAMAMQRGRRRRKIRARDALMSAESECSSRSREQDQDSEAGGKRMKYSSGPDLPELPSAACFLRKPLIMLLEKEYSIFLSDYRLCATMCRAPGDIWHHIYSLVPIQDAARAACVSRAFRRRWRCYPNLSFSNLIVDWSGDIHVKHEPAREFSSRVNQVLTSHSGGLKTLRLEFIGPSSSDCCSLDKWLQVAITPVIEELSFQLSSPLATYSFPCSLLSDLSGNSIRHLHLAGCAFRPAVRFSCLRSLAQLHLYHVGIKEDELGCLLSSCPVLELFAIGNCSGITCLKIPCTLDRLRRLHIISCNALRAIESKAPNLFSFYFAGKRVQLSLGEPLQLEKLVLSHPQALDDARATLPSIAPNLQTLRITSCLGAINPMMHSRFLYLKFLNIWVHTYPFHGANDYMSLVSFLDACPSLETFALTTPTEPMEHESIIGDPSHLRRMPGHRHDKLKSMKVLGFNSAKSLIELTVHIIENAGSLESLSLDTTYYAVRCSDGISDTCSSMRERTRMEAPRALLAIQTHIQGKVPSTVKLDVLGPCSRCHAS